MSRLVLLGLVLAACSEKEEGAPNGRPPEPVPPSVIEKWVKTSLWDFDLYVPEPWSRSYRAFGPNQVHFSAPKDDRFMPQLQVHWSPSKVKPADWIARQVRRFSSAPDVKVWQNGESVVAGMPARYLVYGQTARHPETRDVMDFRTLDIYFAGHGYAGMIRGVSTARTFPEYRRLFQEVARRLRYRGKR